MRPSQILAVATVDMEAAPEAREQLIWFYKDVVGLECVDEAVDTSKLRFRSARLELHIRIQPDARVEKVRRRALLSVRSLDATAGVLEEAGLPFQRITGMTSTDLKISLLDPGDNRVELKQEWRNGVFTGEASPNEGAI